MMSSSNSRARVGLICVLGSILGAASLLLLFGDLAEPADSAVRRGPTNQPQDHVPTHDEVMSTERRKPKSPGSARLQLRDRENHVEVHDERGPTVDINVLGVRNPYSYTSVRVSLRDMRGRLVGRQRVPGQSLYTCVRLVAWRGGIQA